MADQTPPVTQGRLGNLLHGPVGEKIVSLTKILRPRKAEEMPVKIIAVDGDDPAAVTYMIKFLYYSITITSPNLTRMISEMSPPPIPPAQVWNMEDLAKIIRYWNETCAGMMQGPFAHTAGPNGLVYFSLVPTINIVALSPLTMSLRAASRMKMSPESRSQDQHWALLAENWRDSFKPDITIQILRHNGQSRLPSNQEIAHRQGEVKFVNKHTVLVTCGTHGPMESTNDGIDRHGFSKRQLEFVRHVVKGWLSSPEPPPLSGPLAPPGYLLHRQEVQNPADFRHPPSAPKPLQTYGSASPMTHAPVFPSIRGPASPATGASALSSQTVFRRPALQMPYGPQTAAPLMPPPSPLYRETRDKHHPRPQQRGGPTHRRELTHKRSTEGKILTKTSDDGEDKVFKSEPGQI